MPLQKVFSFGVVSAVSASP